jgi:heterodisulfide reductase subunit B
LVNDILENASEVGADAIAVACPLCHANLDTRQEEVNDLYKKKYNLPILYFTQFMGLAFGFGIKELSLNKHFVIPEKLLKRLKIGV